MPASIEAARAGVTTGEWGDCLRLQFGEFRAPTGVSPKARQQAAGLDALRGEVERVSLKLGRRIKFLIGKPGLDGHSNGAEQIAARATDAGMDVIYDGIRFTPAELVERAKSGVHCVGLSILSGSHLLLTEELLAKLRSEGLDHLPLVVGGIIPAADADRLLRPEWRRFILPKILKLTPCSAPLFPRSRGASTRIRRRQEKLPRSPGRA